MNRCLKPLAVAIMTAWIGGCSLVPDSRFDTVTEATFQEVEAYRFGQSRASLSAIEDKIVQSQNAPETRRMLAQRLAEILMHDSTFEAQQFACRQLALIGSGEQVPMLLPALMEEKTTDIARMALEAIPGAEADRVLVCGLWAAPESKRVGIINSIGKRRIYWAVGHLNDFLNGRDARPDTARAAAAALGQIGGDRPIQSLWRAKVLHDLNLDGVVTNALLECANALLANRDLAAAAHIYDRLFAPNEPAPVIHAAMKGLIAAEDRDQAMETIMEACNRPYGAIAAVAIRGLGDIGDARAVPLLAEIAGNREGQIREEARSSLVRLIGTDVDEALTAGIARSDPSVRAEIIRALGLRGVPGAVPAMIESAHDADEAVRRESFAALARLAEDYHLHALLELLIHESNDEARARAEEAVITAARKGEQPEVQAEAVAWALRSASSIAVRVSLLRVLGQLRGDRALRLLTRALKSDDPELQAVSIDALAQWDDARPAGALLNVVEQSVQGQNREAALAGYVHLLTLADNRPARRTMAGLRKAMELAHTRTEKRRVIEGLAEVRLPGALRLAKSYLDDDDLKDAAVASVLGIARGIGATNPTAVKTALKQVIEKSGDRQANERAKRIIGYIERFDDYITAWQVAGPYKQRNRRASDLFDLVFDPERPGDTAVVWKGVSTGSNSGRPWIIDLQREIGGDDRVAYLRTRVISPRQQKVRLEIGSDDGVKVWLNGKLVLAQNASRSVSPGDDKVDVELKEGRNDLMLKVVNGSNDWGACARFRALDGSKLKGLRARIGRN